MSYSEIIAFDKNKKIITTLKIENSNRGARAIWEELINLYLKETSLRKLFEENKMNDLWDLLENYRLDKKEKICLLYTLDYSLTDRKNYLNLIDALKSMSNEYNNLSLQAEYIDVLFKNKSVEYIGVHNTSLSEGCWYNENSINKSYLIFDEECLKKEINKNALNIKYKYNSIIKKLISTKKSIEKLSVELIKIEFADFEEISKIIDFEIEKLKHRRDIKIKRLIELSQ